LVCFEEQITKELWIEGASGTAFVSSTAHMEFGTDYHAPKPPPPRRPPPSRNIKVTSPPPLPAKPPPVPKRQKITLSPIPKRSSQVSRSKAITNIKGECKDESIVPISLTS
jgi:hypothetical protein